MQIRTCGNDPDKAGCCRQKGMKNSGEPYHIYQAEEGDDDVGELCLMARAGDDESVYFKNSTSYQMLCPVQTRLGFQARIASQSPVSQQWPCLDKTTLTFTKQKYQLASLVTLASCILPGIEEQITIRYDIFFVSFLLEIKLNLKSTLQLLSLELNLQY